MRRRLGQCVALVTLAVSVMLSAEDVSGASGVTVTIPTFRVSINGEEIDSRYSRYPLIVYRDITYFPMTYSDCRFLGLESDWRGNREGLSIRATDITAGYSPYRTGKKNSGSYKATIPGFPIRVNGELINNGAEQHPILTFRDVTYFPITWKFAVDEFGWDYRFDPEQGLKIASHNAHLLQSPVPNDRVPETSIAIADGYVYYVGARGRIMQSRLLPSKGSVAQAKKPSAGTPVYQLPTDGMGGGTSYVNAALYAEDGAAYLAYHTGGATMGTDYLFRLSSGGAVLINDSQNVFRAFGDQAFQWWAGPMPGPGNLYMKAPGSVPSGESTYSGWKKIGSPDYLYGWSWRISDADGANSAFAGGSGSRDCCLFGDDLYILGFDFKAGSDYTEHGGTRPTTGLYRVNIRTDETVRISNREILGFRAEGDFLYYFDSDSSFFRYDMRERKETLVSSNPGKSRDFAGAFVVLGGRAYFEGAEGRHLYNLSGEAIGAEIQELKLTGTEKKYVGATLTGSRVLPDRILLLDASGSKAFRSSDEAEGLTVEGSRVYYFNKNTGTVCIGELGSAGR